MEGQATYEAKEIPKTLGEVLQALCAPFPEEQCGWRILTRRGPGDNWVWVKYPVGDYMKLRLAQSCPAGYDIDFAEDQNNNGVATARATLVIYDPERPTEHHMVVPGIGEADLEKDQAGIKSILTADVWKTAHTYALKDALEKVGMGVGVGERKYTLPYHNPDGEKTDKNGIPLSEYKNGSMTGKRRQPDSPQPPTNDNSALINAVAVKTWLEDRVSSIDPAHLTAESRKKNGLDLTNTLKGMDFDPKAVMVAAWGEGKPTAQQIIAVQNLAARTHGKEEIQHLL